MKHSFFRQWLQLSLIWIVIAIVPVGRAFLFDIYLFDLWFYLIILVMGIIICPVIIIWLNYLQKMNWNWVVVISVQFFLSITIALLFHFTTISGTGASKRRMSIQEFEAMPATQKFRTQLFSGSSYSVFTSLIMLSGLGLLIVYNEQLRLRKIKESVLRENLALSQIKALQSELQPHFLFNTLHSASSLMETDVDKAQQLIERLSFLLRNYLDIINLRFYSLNEEIMFLKEYVEVQQLRHNGTIELITDIPAEQLRVQVPVVLLQPIVENSIAHGWTDRKKTLVISVKAEIIERKLIISVTDNGSGQTSASRSGIGLRNLMERLSALYETDFDFLHEKKDGYHSRLTLPLKYEADQGIDNRR